MDPSEIFECTRMHCKGMRLGQCIKRQKAYSEEACRYVNLECQGCVQGSLIKSLLEQSQEERAEHVHP